MALVQSQTAVDTGASMNLPGAPTPGDLVIVTVWEKQGGVAPPAASLTGFTQVGAFQQTSAIFNTWTHSLWRRVAQVGDTSSIAFGWGGSPPDHFAAVAAEFSALSSFDTTASAGFTVGINESVTLAPVVGQTDLIVAGLAAVNGNVPGDQGFDAGAGYTMIGTALPDGHGVVGLEYRQKTSAASETATATTNPAGFNSPADSHWAAIGAVFRLVSGGAAFTGEPGGGVW